MGCGASKVKTAYVVIRDVSYEVIWPRVGVPGSDETVRLCSVNAKVWPIGSDFVFPELRPDDHGVAALQAKPSFAICLSGGGFRATTLALGWVRALHKMGLLAKAQYLSSNSGGSWFNVCFSYQEKESVETFLGEYISPEELTLQRLSETPAGSYAKTIADARHCGPFFLNWCKGWLAMDSFREEDTVHVRAWSETVGDSFLAQHGLNDHDCAYSLAGSEAEYTKEVTGVRKVHTAMRSHNMPYPVVIACIQARDKYAEKPRYYYPFEFTPQYSGVPACIPDASPIKLGGHLISPFAANSKPPRSNLFPDGAFGEIKVEVPWVVPLPQVAGMSSQAVCQICGRGGASEEHKFWEFMGGPELNLWNSMDFEGAEMRCGDGGGNDNAAIFPPLRRKVRALLVCLGFQANPAEWDEHSIREIADKFGRATTTHKGWLDLASWNKSQQVFPSEKWDEFLSMAQRLHAQDQPVAFRMKLAVLRNEAQGVQGGYEAEVFFVANVMPSAWKSSLPADTRQLLEDGGKGKVPESFPGIPVSVLDYEPELVVLLSQLANWTMLLQEDALHSLLSAQDQIKA